MPSPLHGVIGKYSVDRFIGSGGIGDVYLAHDPVLDRPVAIKVLRHRFDGNEMRERFEREARAAGRLLHPNIVTIYEFGDFLGWPFIAMEFVRGEPLSTVIARREPIPLVRKFELMEGLCSGLGHAHKAGIVHRDIKPANLMVGAAGPLKILDFGIVRMAGSGMTNPGALIGAVNYMSPEQITGASAIDHRSDIFAVGSVLYEVFTYQRAFPGEMADVLYKIVHAQPEPPVALAPGLDPAIVRMIEQCLEKAPERRYQDLAVLRRDLARLRQRYEPEAPETSGHTAAIARPPLAMEGERVRAQEWERARVERARAEDAERDRSAREESERAERERMAREQAERAERARIAREELERAREEAQSARAEEARHARDEALRRSATVEARPTRAEASPPTSVGVPAPVPSASRRHDGPSFIWLPFVALAGGASRLLQRVMSRGHAHRQLPAGAVVDDVHFTLTAPKSIRPGASAEIIFWCHLASERAAVLREALLLLGRRPSEMALKSEGPVEVARGTSLAVSLEIDGVSMQPGTKTILWRGRTGNATFVATPPRECAPGDHKGTASIRVDGVEIARLDFTLSVGSGRSLRRRKHQSVVRHRTAFASYAHEDRTEVMKRVQGICKAVPTLTVFVDVVTLRSGQYWEEEIRTRIPRSDVFYLFWSRHARASKWVDAEWRMAYAAKGLDFIDPVPLEPATMAPPPDELAARHFDDPLMPYLR